MMTEQQTIEAQASQLVEQVLSKVRKESKAKVETPKAENDKAGE